jgi:hypothetical protein
MVSINKPWLEFIVRAETHAFADVLNMDYRTDARKLQLIRERYRILMKTICQPKTTPNDYFSTHPFFKRKVCNLRTNPDRALRIAQESQLMFEDWRLLVTSFEQAYHSRKNERRNHEYLQRAIWHHTRILAREELLCSNQEVYLVGFKGTKHEHNPNNPVRKIFRNRHTYMKHYLQNGVLFDDEYLPTYPNQRIY